MKAEAARVGEAMAAVAAMAAAREVEARAVELAAGWAAAAREVE